MFKGYEMMSSTDSLYIKLVMFITYFMYYISMKNNWQIVEEIIMSASKHVNCECGTRQ